MPHMYSLDGVVIDGVPPRLALYPYGGFTSLIVVSGQALGWSFHEERLAAATETLWEHELDRVLLRRLIRTHMDHQGPVASSLRVTVQPQEFDLARPDLAKGCHVLLSSARCDPEVRAVSTFSVQGVPYVRSLAYLKSTDLFSQIHFRRSARIAGFDDALLLAGDAVREGTTWSIITCTDQEMVTPETDVLASVTVKQLQKVADSLGLRFRYGAVDYSDLFAADLVLAVNVNNPARAISSVDGRPVRVDDDLLDKIASEFQALEKETI